MKSLVVLGTLLALATVSAGCSSGGLVVGTDTAKDTGGDDGTGATDAGGTGSCTSDNDCSSTTICGFRQSLSCGATGQCFPRPEATCLAYSEACACDGTNYNVACSGLPTGYVPKPFLHANACADGGTGPTPDAGLPASCTTNADCGNGNLCGFPTAAACSATGTCFPSPGATCGAYSPGCACDGSVINIACNGLPSNYTSKPLLHTGNCADGGI